MREMKDSGIEWIGKIPTDWYAVRIKYLSKRIIVGLAMPVTQYYVVDGVPIFRNTNIEGDYLDDKELLYLEPRFAYSQRSKKIKTNDILTIHTGYVGKSCLVPKEYDGALTFTTLITTADKSMVLPRFLMYTINASREKSSIYIVDSSAQNNLNTAVFINLPLPKPSIDEQKALVVFLDSKCAEIDALYKEIENQIKTLEEYKRSVITEAVTKGLNPETEMKDSGIEWVEEIPSHWHIHPVYYYFGERKNKNYRLQEQNLLSLSYGKIIRKDINASGGLLPASFNTYNIVEAGDIIIRPTDLQNDKRSLRTGLVKERGIITSAYIDLMPKGEVNSEYYHYLLHSYDIQKVFYNMGNGVRQGLNYSEFSKLMIFSPPLNEQKQIADYLNSKCSEIEAIIGNKKEQLELLEEYKKSLIYEYVTGKKEVVTNE